MKIAQTPAHPESLRLVGPAKGVRAADDHRVAWRTAVVALGSMDVAPVSEDWALARVAADYEGAVVILASVSDAAAGLTGSVAGRADSGPVATRRLKLGWLMTLVGSAATDSLSRSRRCNNLPGGDRHHLRTSQQGHRCTMMDRDVTKRVVVPQSRRVFCPSPMSVRQCLPPAGHSLRFVRSLRSSRRAPQSRRIPCE